MCLCVLCVYYVAAWCVSIGLRVWEDCSRPKSCDQPTFTTAHNSHQTCVRVVPPEDGQVMPETCRDFEP
jgi:hypothetical protein